VIKSPQWFQDYRGEDAVTLAACFCLPGRVPASRATSFSRVILASARRPALFCRDRQTTSITGREVESHASQSDGAKGDLLIQSESHSAEQGARANVHIGHASCYSTLYRFEVSDRVSEQGTSHARCGRGSSLTFGKTRTLWTVTRSRSRFDHQ